MGLSRSDCYRYTVLDSGNFDDERPLACGVGQSQTKVYQAKTTEASKSDEEKVATLQIVSIAVRTREPARSKKRLSNPHH